jgi:CBS domain-containing protein
MEVLMTQLREIMTREVHCIPPDTSLRHAAQKMKSWDVGALPICENDRLIGVVTDRDIAIRAVAEGQNPDASTVKEAMTRDLVFCFDDEDVQRAAELMEKRQIRRLPILNRSKRLVGIVSLGDLAIRLHDANLCHEALEQISQPNQMPA